jgi:hypothetical protein
LLSFLDGGGNFHQVVAWGSYRAPSTVSCGAEGARGEVDTQYVLLEPEGGYSRLFGVAFLATKISFSNEVGNICKELGIDTYEVMKALDEQLGLDHSYIYGKGSLMHSLSLNLKKMVEILEISNFRVLTPFYQDTLLTLFQL